MSASKTISITDRINGVDMAPRDTIRTAGQTLQFQGFGVMDITGQRVDRTSTATWLSSNPAVARFAAADPRGLARLLAPGTATIYATFPGGFFAITTLTITPTLTAISVPPPLLTMPPNQGVQLQALGTFADRSTWDLTSAVTWATSNPAVATVTPTGLATTRAIGTTTITATWGGMTGTLLLTVVGPQPAITITSPAAGAMISSDRVLVRGTVITSTPERGVVVNGRRAHVNGNQWAVEVPLQRGGNVLLATAIDATGATLTTSISVTVPDTAPPAPLILAARPESGVTPLPVRLEVTDQTGRRLIRFELDPTGGGTFDPPEPPVVSYTLTYPGPGRLLFPTLRATDDQGQTYLATTVVNLLDRAPTDAAIRAKWVALKAALERNDIDGALEFIYPTQRPRYRAIYTAIGAQLSQIARDMEDIQLIVLRDRQATYRLQRTELVGGQPQRVTYYVELIQDMRGIWRIMDY